MSRSLGLTRLSFSDYIFLLPICSFLIVCFLFPVASHRADIISCRLPKYMRSPEFYSSFSLLLQDQLRVDKPFWYFWNDHITRVRLCTRACLCCFPVFLLLVSLKEIHYAQQYCKVKSFARHTLQLGSIGSGVCIFRRFFNLDWT